MGNRPILAVDVDGVLNALNRGGLPEGWADAEVTMSGLGALRIRHNPGHGRRLLEIADETGAELVWCTTWEDKANKHIAPLVGLPDLPVVPMAPGFYGLKFSQRGSTGLIKGKALAAYAGDRPFCWLDDEEDAAEHLTDMTRPPHLVVRVPWETGLQEEHFEQARAWLLSNCTERRAVED